MSARALMLQGTASDVGKSMLTAALCRIARRRGINVVPFKPQNMSNNAAACACGGEIGRAQALQARAAGLAPRTDMNPVLLKPQTDRAAQIVLQGRAIGSKEAAEYMASRDQLMGSVMESFARLAEAHDLIIVEGAGSPAEINLRDRDIANMGFARQVGAPVFLIGDVDRGGVIANIVGTKKVLGSADAGMICGFIINKFRGDPRLFDDGVVAIEQRTDWPCLGVVPWLAACAHLPAEDAVVLERPAQTNEGRLKIAAPMLSRIANFDDADPLKMEPRIDFRWIRPGEPIPRDTNVVILFGTKSTLGDLAFLRQQGWDHDIIAHARNGGRVFGVCGGYQMLGDVVSDPDGFDGDGGEAPGLGLLHVKTVMTSEKEVTPVEGMCAQNGDPVQGYEIHAGETTGPDTRRPIFQLGNRTDGARSVDGLIEGTNLHGAFASDAFRRYWLARAGIAAEENLQYESAVERALDDLADGVEASIDIDRMLEAAAPVTL